MTAVVGALVLLSVIEGILILGLLRSHAEILRRLHHLDGGTEPPAAGPGAGTTSARADGAPEPRPARDLTGGTLTDDAALIRVTGVSHRTLLVFLSSSCGTCRAFWDALADGEHVMLPPDVRVVVVAQSEPDEDRAALEELAPADVSLVMSSQAWIDYGVQGSPYVVLVHPVDGVEGEGTGMTFTQVRRLLAQSTGDIGFLGRTAPRADGARRAAGSGRDDAGRIDAELSAAGLTPGDPALYGKEQGPR